MLEYVGCNLCSSKESKPYAKVSVGGKELNLVKCKICGLIYLNPRLNQKDLHALYNETYFETYYPHQNQEQLKERMQQADTLIKKINHYCPDKGRILDIGSGLGCCLKVARDYSWEVFGVELSPYAVKFAKEKFGLEVFNGIIEEAKFADNFFDVVIMTHTLEHLPNPLASLKEVYRILKPGGALQLVVPNASSFNNWLSKEKEAHALDVHLYYFSPKTLKKIILKVGFKINRIDTSQPVITAEKLHLAKIKKQLKLIKYLKPAVQLLRRIVGKVFPGEGITVVAKK